MAEIQTYVQSNCDVLGLAVSGVPEPEYDAVHSTLKRGLKQAGVGYLGAQPCPSLLSSHARDRNLQHHIARARHAPPRACPPPQPPRAVRQGCPFI